MGSRKGFTLIELLIVVAIIAILAAIAVPNFLEAQMRAKVSRTQTDMRSVSVAIESYKVDTNRYPRVMDQPQYTLPGGPDSVIRAGGMTSPIAYLSSLPLDPFGTVMPDDQFRPFGVIAENYYYASKQYFERFPGAWRVSTTDSADNTADWVLLSKGPDKYYAPPGGGDEVEHVDRHRDIASKDLGRQQHAPYRKQQGIEKHQRQQAPPPAAPAPQYTNHQRNE